MRVYVRATLRGGVVALVGACMVTSNVFVQSKELRFDAVSIKPLGPAGGPVPFSGELILPGGTFRDPGTQLRYLMQQPTISRNPLLK